MDWRLPVGAVSNVPKRKHSPAIDSSCSFLWLEKPDQSYFKDVSVRICQWNPLDLATSSSFTKMNSSKDLMMCPRPNPVYYKIIQIDSLTWICPISSLLAFILHFVVIRIRYHRTHSRASDPQLPPVYPHLFPFIGSTLLYVFDNPNFLRRAT